MVRMVGYEAGLPMIFGKQSVKLDQMDQLIKFAHVILIRKSFLLPKLN